MNSNGRYLRGNLLENSISKTRQNVILEIKNGPPHLPVPTGRFPNPPNLQENPLNLFTTPYCDLIDQITARLFPDNVKISASGKKVRLKSTNARIDRFILLKAAWIPQFNITLQLALRDFTESCLKRNKQHFSSLPFQIQDQMLEHLELGEFTNAEWRVLRGQKEAFAIIYDAITEGFFADPGYGGNHQRVGWKYSNFTGSGV